MTVIKRDTTGVQYQAVAQFMAGMGYEAQMTERKRIVFVSTVKETGAFRIIPLYNAVAIYNRADSFTEKFTRRGLTYLSYRNDEEPNSVASKFYFPAYLMGLVKAGRPIQRVSVRQHPDGELMSDRAWVEFINDSQGLLYKQFYQLPALEEVEED